MIFVFLFISKVSAKYHKMPAQSIAVGIWAGKETISNRVLNQAKSWMRFWDVINIFTDDIKPGECEELNRESNPCKVVCINIGNLAEHLDGTEWENRWYSAQPRFLPSMFSLYEHYPNSTWFLFGDDDTYFFRPSIERKLREFDSNTKIVLGKFWSSWQRVTQDVPPFRHEHPFAQGGAGVCISHAMMTKIGPHLKNCSMFFNDPDFAGSMRFAMCAEKVVGQHEWSLDGAIRTWYTGFHSSPPDFEISDRTVSEAPASFHRITKPEMFVPIKRAHIMESLNDEKLSFDLGLFAFTKHFLYLGSEVNRFEWRFGLWIGLQDSSKALLNAISDWMPLIINGELIEFSQEYQNGVKVHCKCDESIPEGKTYFSHFKDKYGSEPVMLLPCSNITVVKHRIQF